MEFSEPNAAEHSNLASQEVLVKRRKSNRNKVNTIYVQNNRFSRYGHAIQSLIPIKIGNGEKLSVENSGLLSFITFSWAIKYLFADNLDFECPRTETCSLNSGRLGTILNKYIQLKGKNASVLLIIWGFIKTRTIFASIFYLLSMIFSLIGLIFFLPKVLLKPRDNFLEIIFLVLLQFLSYIFHSWSSAINLRTAVRFRSACFSLLFRQSMFASLTYKISSWQIISFLLPEGKQIDELIMNIPHLICTPIIIFSCIGFAAHNLELWGCMSVVIFVLFFPILIVAALLIKKFVNRASIFSEKKIKLLEEFIVNNLYVKLFQKEKSFEKKIREIRKNEMGNVKLSEFYNKLGYSLIQTQPVLSLSVLCIAYHVHSQINLMNAETEAQITAVCIVMLVHLKYYLDDFWSGLNSFAKGLVSMKKIMKILVLEPIEEHPIKPKGLAILVEDASFIQIKDKSISGTLTLKYKNNKSDPSPLSEKSEILTQISMSIAKGSLVGVCGLPGSGKSAVLLSIMGLLERTNGKLQVDGEFAYVSQDPFIFNDTLRVNILFGRSMDTAKYFRVLMHCDLTEFESELNRDRHKIILESSSLTLDERQRIALARALYADKNIYLFDHFLSGTDMDQALKIFNDCILSAEDKTRIIVTDNPKFLAECHLVYMMSEGTIVAYNTHEELIKYEEYINLMAQFSKSNNGSSHRDDNSIFKNLSQSQNSLFDSIDTLGIDSTDETPLTKSLSEPSVSFTSIVRMHFINCCNVTSVFSLIIAILHGLFIIFLPIFFVETLKTDYLTPVGVLSIYLGTFITLLVSSLVFNLFFNMKTYSSASNFQKRILNKIYNASLSFFQEKSLSIISAVSVHLHLGDSEIPLLFHGTMISIFIIIMCSLMAGLASFWYLIPAVFILIFILIATIAVGKTLLKFNSLKTEKINVLYRKVVTALAAKPLIQAFRRMDDFIKRLNEDYNDYIVATYILNATKGLLIFTINILSLFFLLTICLLTGFLPEDHNYLCYILRDVNEPSIICFALIIFCVFQIIFHTQKLSMYLIDSTLAYDTWLIVKDFQNNIKEENNLFENNTGINESCYAIAFMDVSLSIGYDRKILEDLNFMIEAKEKMGIIGLSNLEKKSIISALYRLNDVNKGTITIGKLNSYEIPLSKLRSMISIIPVESHLFNETITNILNPKGSETQDKITRALTLFELYEKIMKLSDKQDSSVEFLTPDEKQVLLLICAYLKQTPIVIIEDFRFNSLMDYCLRKNLNDLFPTTTFIIFANDTRCFSACSRYIVFQHGKVVKIEDVKIETSRKKLSRRYPSTEDILAMENIPETSF